MEQLKEIIEKIDSNYTTIRESKNLSGQNDEKNDTKYKSMIDNIEKVCDISLNNIYVLGVSQNKYFKDYEKWEYITLMRDFSFNAE